MVSLIAVFMPWFAVANMNEEISSQGEKPQKEAYDEIITENENEQEGENAENKKFTVNVLMNGEIVEMELEKYIVGVVAGEMPVSFEDEALKAQAVAARTYTLHKMWIEPSANHGGDVCTDAACCKAYADESVLREKWGEDYDENIAKITAAVWDTEGVYMVYNGEPVLAVFHSSSAGATENSGNVWNKDVPYLVSVESPENSDSVTNYVSTTEIGFDEFINIFMQKYPEASFSEDKQSWITDVVYSESGRINTVVVGGIEIRGTELRELYSLRSTAVSVAMGANGVVFISTGYGHGVGMSQYGANKMAQDGSDWREILCWYYTGIGFSTLVPTV